MGSPATSVGASAPFYQLPGTSGFSNVSSSTGRGGSPGIEMSASPRLLSSRETSSAAGSDGLRRAALGPSSRRSGRTHAVVVVGPPG